MLWCFVIISDLTQSSAALPGNTCCHVFGYSIDWDAYSLDYTLCSFTIMSETMSQFQSEVQHDLPETLAEGVRRQSLT